MAEVDQIFNIFGVLLAHWLDDFMEDDGEEQAWEKITVNVNEFCMMGYPSFRRHFRLTKPVFESLVVEIGNHLVERGCLLRERRPIAHILLMVLWILATPETFRAVALRFGVYPGEVHYHYVYIIEALREMGERFITWPTEEERAVIKRNLERVSNFPGIIGMMDGCHIPIPSPVEDKAVYRNYHHGHFIKFQAICDDKLLLRDIYVGEAGSLHDARVFRRSPVFRSILTAPNFIGDGEHIIADSAYPVMDKVLVPFVNNGHLTRAQRNFNWRLSQVRSRIENTFARADSLWRRLFFLPCRNLEYAVDHIVASLVLHNFKILHGQRDEIVNAWNNDFEEDPEEDPHDPVVDEDAPVQQQGVPDAIHDPHIPQGQFVELFQNAQLRGEQKRWDICNRLAGL